MKFDVENKSSIFSRKKPPLPTARTNMFYHRKSTDDCKLTNVDTLKIRNL